MKHSFGLDVFGGSTAGCGPATLVAVILDQLNSKQLLQWPQMFSAPIPVRRAREPPELWTEGYDF